MELSTPGDRDSVDLELEPNSDPFEAFSSETVPASAPVGAAPHPNIHWSRVARSAAIATLSLAVLAAGAYGTVRSVADRRAAAATGRVTVSSNPAGVHLLVDGIARGMTPVTLDLGVGAHQLTLRSGPLSKDIRITARQDVELAQHVEMGAPPPTTGSLAVSSEPSGLTVSVDGQARGTTPAVIDRLPAGTHTVRLSGHGTTAERTVVVRAGGVASLVVSRSSEPPAGGGVGSVVVSAPIDLELFQGDALIGTSRSARLFLPAGSHTLTAVNAALGFRRTITVDVKPGTPARVNVPVPEGTLSVNARPWAEVILDGKSLGETPIGNISLSIGSHELVLRHPQFGEHRQTVVIAVGTPARIGVDLRK